MSERKTILVVDDEPDVVRSVKDLLRLDYRVLGATRATEALDILQKEPVQVVMSDQRMPEMSGVEFLRRVREVRPDAVRLLFTGYADIRAVIDAINQGNVYRYITKPWEPDELQAVIREACDRYDLVAERKQLVEELREKNDELERKNRQLQESDALKQAFIQVASHELRTPLTILLGLVNLSLRAPKDFEMQDWLKRIAQAGQRMQHLVNQLLSLLAAGQFDRVLERKSENLSSLLMQALDDVRPFAELRKQRLSVNLPPDGLGTFNVDAMKIRDTLNHLLLNAVKFTADGGAIALSARCDERGATIAVSDTGSGISPSALAHMFRPFFTGFDVSRHSSGVFEFGRQGLGLGLTVVKSFVEMHGGRVSVSSELGKGSTFTIFLPSDGAVTTA